MYQPQSFAKFNHQSSRGFLTHPSSSVTSAILSVIIALLLASLSAPARAQSAAPSPDSEEITRLREQKTRVELEKDIAVAEKAKLDAQFPKPTTSPLAGETKINDGAAIESDMVSYVSMASQQPRQSFERVWNPYQETCHL